MGDDANVTDNVTIWDNDGGKAVTVTTDGSKERLDVDARIFEIDDDAVKARVSQPVQIYESDNTDRTKAEYTVPTGKQLWVQFFTVSLVEGKMSIAFQVGGATIYAAGLNEDGTSAFAVNAPINNPFGPISAGTEVRLYRLTGDSGKKWGGAYFGYLEDV